MLPLLMSFVFLNNFTAHIIVSACFIIIIIIILLLGVMKCLIHRALRLCIREEDLRWELGFLKDHFISNGYLVSEVDRMFASYVPGVGVEEEEVD